MWLLFELLSCAVFFCAIGFVLAGARTAGAKLIKKDREKLTWLNVASLVLAIAGVICVAYSFYEPYQLTVTRVSLKSPKLSFGDDLRLVLISDSHFDVMDRFGNGLFEAISKEHPDLILFTGDATNNQFGVAKFKSLIGQLETLAPVVVVSGNNDLAPGRDKQSIYSGTQARVVTSETGVSAKIRMLPISIAGTGADAVDERSVLRGANSVKADSYNIYLCHYPHVVEKIADKNIDLMCAGHTHGGQVRLPFWGALITNSPTGKQYESGLYDVHGTSLFVSRGIGTIGLPIRFLAPPEIVVIDVKPL